jgi:ubiquinone/menaquinone biosynthesis C-methylase UbiE
MLSPKGEKFMRRRREVSYQTVLFVAAAITFLPGSTLCQENHGLNSRDAIDKMRDRDLQPERILDVIELRDGMKTGEAGASYGYFTFKMSRRVGTKGVVYANDIDPNALKQIEERCQSEKIANIRTVLGAVEDPLFPEKDLDMVVVFDCLFEFSEPAGWMRNARKYIKENGRLVVVDPDPAKIGSTEHFLSRRQVVDFATEAGYKLIKVDDSFLKSHMIMILQRDNDKEGSGVMKKSGVSEGNRTSDLWIRRATLPGLSTAGAGGKVA